MERCIRGQKAINKFIIFVKQKNIQLWKAHIMN